MASIIVGEPQWKYWMTFLGRPASSKMDLICSTIVGVCGDGFKITELPARRAGINELIRIKYGYYQQIRLIQEMSLTVWRLTFHAKIMRTGPTGILRINLLKPFSSSPSVSLSVSSLIFSRYSALLTAVATSFAV